MLILSAGMEKSGSAYFYNIINDLLVESGSGVDARQLKVKRNLGHLMQWHNNNIGDLTFIKLFKLWVVSLQEGTFVVKTHARPNRATKILSNLGLVRIVYCYRDPRDVLLSAIDHGKKILSSDESHTFANMVDFDVAIKYVKVWLSIWKDYDQIPGVLSLKYEEMMQDPDTVTEKILDFLKISLDSNQKQSILWKVSKDNPEGERTGLHFNKAKIYRYKTDMSENQKAKCKEEFSKFLVQMGYESY